MLLLGLKYSIKCLLLLDLVQSKGPYEEKPLAREGILWLLWINLQSKGFYGYGSIYKERDIRTSEMVATKVISLSEGCFQIPKLIFFPVFLPLSASTHDQDVFSFFPDDSFCNGFEQVLSKYREIIPHLKLAGPTSFAPVIEMAMTIVEQSGGQYHVLLIIADGQGIGAKENRRVGLKYLALYTKLHSRF
ncbi:hypothetical protein PIB30_079065 [Stylosanthes scabra]|uniref:Copine C-terminal domain-containing protein n=1 Tax=Stylosanthes scabra TaxID=79078 RepID=A0ABU6XP20_9FABA|nr:hypothetical protein [Stylosanthes scabra]